MTTVTAGRLVEDAQEFLRFKRAMGIPYRRGEFVLDQLRPLCRTTMGQ